jgi:hypothetical protein
MLILELKDKTDFVLAENGRHLCTLKTFRRRSNGNWQVGFDCPDAVQITKKTPLQRRIADDDDANHRC